MYRETNEIPTCGEVKRLDAVDVMHHVLARGAREIQSPHELLGWSIPKYSQWLDTVGAEKVWQVLQRALNLYAQQIDKRGEKQYDPVYPLLMDLGPQLLQSRE